MEIQFKHLQRIIKIVVHHTAVSYLKNPDQWEATNNYHKKIFKPYEKNWADYKSSLGFYNGYNFEIAMNGKTRQARKIGETTGAVYQQGLNSGIAVHIALDGAFDIELPTRDHERALRDLLIKLLSLCKNAEITYHRDFANKTCPGKNITDEFIKSLIKKPMEYVIQNGEQYLRTTNPFNFALNIGNEKVLVKLVADGLKGKPTVVTDMNKYKVYPLIDKGTARELIKNLKDLIGD